MYILDEPTTGLHSADVERLIEILNRLTDAGNTVLVIEHNLDMIKIADHIVDMGPEGGERGGQIIAAGTPEEVAASKVSYTGAFLKDFLRKEKNNGKTGSAGAAWEDPLPRGRAVYLSPSAGAFRNRTLSRERRCLPDSPLPAPCCV